jgi:hypothetical protein
MLSERVIDSAANYIASATRCKATWDACFEQSTDGDPLTPRDLVEMHSARLGLIWTTSTTDLPSALAVLRYVEAASSAVGAGLDQPRDQARRVLEGLIKDGVLDSAVPFAFSA